MFFTASTSGHERSSQVVHFMCVFFNLCSILFCTRIVIEIDERRVDGNVKVEAGLVRET